MTMRKSNDRARLPALPPVASQDPSVRAWMQAVTERMEVREGSRGDDNERVVTKRDLEEFLSGNTASQSTGTSGWIDEYKDIGALGEGLKSTPMHDDLLRRISGVVDEFEVTGSYSPRVASQTPAPAYLPPDALRMTRNDLDFFKLPTIKSTSDSTYQELVCTLDVSQFFSLGGNHIIFTLDPEGSAGSGGPHFGPIVRNGANLFERGRGFIIFGDGAVFSEYWNGTTSPAINPRISDSGRDFKPTETPVFTVRIAAGWRKGAMRERMELTIHKGGPNGIILFSTTEMFGWNWRGTHTAYIGAIAPNFISPNDTGFVERTGPGSAPSAVIHVSGPSLRIA